MNEYWQICVFVQPPTFHFMFKGNHLLRQATAKNNFRVCFLEGFTIVHIQK